MPVDTFILYLVGPVTIFPVGTFMVSPVEAFFSMHGGLIKGALIQLL